MAGIGPLGNRIGSAADAAAGATNGAANGTARAAQPPIPRGAFPQPRDTFEPGPADSVFAQQGQGGPAGTNIAQANPPDGNAPKSDGWTWSDIGHTVLDVGGLVPGWGELADVANAAWYAAEGRYLEAGLSLISVVPVVGDVIGKGGKLAVKVADAGMAKAVLKALDQVDVKSVLKTFGSDPRLAPHMAKIEKALDGWVSDLKKIAGVGDGAAGSTPVFRGTLRGAPVDLPGVKTVRYTYVKRGEEALDALRKEFNSTKRKEFVQWLGADPKRVQALKDAGLTDAQIQLLKDGKVPQGWQVHHKLPLDDNGTNDLSNLVLIKNEPYHKAITNAQRELTGDLAAGGSKTVDFPVPDGFIYPPK